MRRKRDRGQAALGVNGNQGTRFSSITRRSRPLEVYRSECFPKHDTWRRCKYACCEHESREGKTRKRWGKWFLRSNSEKADMVMARSMSAENKGCGGQLVLITTCDITFCSFHLSFHHPPLTRLFLELHQNEQIPLCPTDIPEDLTH